MRVKYVCTTGRTRNHHGAERIVRPEVSRVGADMNVTPLIDILLVLLVIFMAALPATQKGLDVNLPPSRGGARRTVSRSRARSS